MTLQDAYDFLKKVGTYYLATADGDQPRVRPFGTVDLFEGKLYIQTGLVKSVSKQIEKNPKVELCGFEDNKWIRLSGVLVLDDRIEAKKHMLDQYPYLRNMYDENDGNTAVYYFESGHVSIEGFGAPKEELDF